LSWAFDLRNGIVGVGGSSAYLCLLFGKIGNTAISQFAKKEAEVNPPNSSLA
jgi:hypothetical protein